MARHKKHEDHEEHASEAWLVAFADMMTLLMVTFLMMFAISSLDLKKFESFEKAFKEGLGKNTHQLPAQGAPPEGTPEDVEIGAKNGTPNPSPSPIPNPTGPEKLQAQTGSSTKPTSSKSPSATPTTTSSSTAGTSTSSAPVLSKADLAPLKAKLEQAVDKAGLAGDVQVSYDPRGLVLYVTSGVLFDPGRASIKGSGTGLLSGLGPVLDSIGNNLIVEGHTDSTPIHTKEFPSNWELSTSRATQVLRFLEDRDHVVAGRMSAAGYADTRPRDPGNSAAARATNRRVDIVVLAQDPPPAPATPAPAPTPVPSGTPAPASTPATSGSKGH